MFQSFDVKSTPEHGKARIAALRGLFTELAVDAILVPRSDEFLGEYVPASAERLLWATGFTGSAGQLLVTENSAIVFVDGRYVTQLDQQVDTTVFTRGDLVGEPPHKWILTHANAGFRLGLDPWMHTGAEVRRIERALADKGSTLVLLPFNPVDRLWTDRPAEPLGPVSIQRESLAGMPAGEKLSRIARELSDKKLDAVLVTDPSSVAWIFNIRGADVPHTPHPLSRAIITANGKAQLFVDSRKINSDVGSYLGDLCELVDPSLLAKRLEELATGGRRILVDPDLTSFALIFMIRTFGGEVIEGDDPAKLGRAVKNKTELTGSAAAHLQDGVAVVEFLHWFGAQPAGSLTEIAAAKALEGSRLRVGERMQNPLKDLSFETIAGAGEHAAIMHYRVTTDSDRSINDGEMFLIDSGAQYVNGTTDITRTVAVGSVSDEQRRFFTLALKGMIAISTARFPKGTRGCDLDPLARIALWKAGADFAHGTGHGVGSYLSVHEGPQRIARLSTQELLPGMILSNEPGYYRPGSFGIRIENLIYVREAEAIDGGDQPMLGFKTLTFVPIDRQLIVEDLLTRDELRWLDDYHAQTRAALLPLIEDASVKAWLEQATEPFGR